MSSGPISDEFDFVMESLDVDNDGKVDYNEFLQAIINAQANLNQTTIKEMFNMFDIDKDGQIDRSELQRIFGKQQVGGVFKRQGPVENSNNDAEQTIMEIMAEVDKNHDNLITYEEFNEALTRRLRDGLQNG